jgi:hypothetical protein
MSLEYQATQIAGMMHIVFSSLLKSEAVRLSSFALLALKNDSNQ